MGDSVMGDFVTGDFVILNFWDSYNFGYFVTGKFFPGGILSWGILSLGDFVMGDFVTGGFCHGGFCHGGFCRRFDTMNWVMNNEAWTHCIFASRQIYMTKVTLLNILTFMLKFYDISCATRVPQLDKGHTAKIILVLQRVRQSEHSMKIIQKNVV